MSDANTNLSMVEQTELMQLLIYKTLLNTTVSDWQQPARDFVGMSLPQGFEDLVKTADNPSAMRESIIADLVVRGISSIQKEFGTIKNIDLMIGNLFSGGITEQ